VVCRVDGGDRRGPETVLFTDGPLGKSNSSMAQGGLQLPPPGAEALARFGDDMRRSARVPLDADRVAAFVGHVEETIACLVDWGLELDRDAHGDVVRRMAGGLSEPRIVSSRDQIGPAIMKILLQHVRAAGVHVVDHARVVDVQPSGRGLRGAIFLRRPAARAHRRRRAAPRHLPRGAGGVDDDNPPTTTTCSSTPAATGLPPSSRLFCPALAWRRVPRGGRALVPRAL
jgi:aspartate oxidase